VIDFSALESLFFLVGIISIPALIIFVVLTYQRIQNAKFRHKHRRRHRESEK
jgi:hypothetical protein